MVGDDEKEGAPASPEGDEASSFSLVPYVEKAASLANLPQLKQNVIKFVERVVGTPDHIRQIAAAKASGDLINEASKTSASLLRAFAERHASEITGGADPYLALRAMNRLAEEAVHSQSNLENTVKKAVALAEEHGEQGDASGEIADDWLFKWGRLAEQTTDQEIQELFAKILAGEAHRPGSFSPETLQALATMTASTARSFERLCNLSISHSKLEVYVVHVNSSHSEEPLQDFGIHYESLLNLMSSSLILTITAANILYKDFGGSTMVIDYVGRECVLRAREGVLEPRLEIVPFSPTGVELRNLIAMEPVPKYTEALRKLFDSHQVDFIGVD